MKRLFVGTLMAALFAIPALGDNEKFSIIASAQWVQRTGANENSSGVTGTQFDVDFEDGVGLGLGFNWFFSDHFSVEAKTSLVESDSTLRVRTSSDSVAVVDLGKIRTYPSTAVLQYHIDTNGNFDPYIGAGGAYTFVQDIRSAFGTFEFEQNAGLVLNAGFDIELSRAWDLNLDAKYIPLETNSEAVSPGAQDLAIEPIIFSAGFRYKF